MKSPLNTASRTSRPPTMDELDALIDAPPSVRSKKPPKKRKQADDKAALAKTTKHFWEYEFTPKKIKPEEVMNFSRQASSFVKAGIPILDALQVIGEDTTDKKLKLVLADIGVRVRAGESFGKAVEAHRTAFPKYFTSMIQSAELTGRLDNVLNQIAIYMDRDLEIGRAHV